METRGLTGSRPTMCCVSSPSMAAFILVFLLATAGCVSLMPRALEPLRRDYVPLAGPMGDCARLFRELDRQSEALGVQDRDAVPVGGFPYLRIDRFSSAWAERIAAAGPKASAARIMLWIRYGRELADEGRRLELRNAGQKLDFGQLGKAASQDLPDLVTLMKTVERCGDMLADADMKNPKVRSDLLERAVVPASYDFVPRLVGLYPLTSSLFTLGVEALHKETRAMFDIPLQALPVRGGLRRYVPGESEGFGSARGFGSVDDLRRLFEMYAPIWEMDALTAADQPGRIQGVGAGVIADPLHPVIYQYLTRAWWKDRPVLQLNYVVWFPARQKKGMLDLQGGHLDGVTWRVTLEESGRVLVADAVHNCGCYYMAFPGHGLRLRPDAEDSAEAILVPSRLPSFDPGTERLVLRFEASTHYLQRVYTAPARSKGATYRRVPYDRLRTLVHPDGVRRSMFRSDGLVDGTERAERWWFWPMGVPSAGAMRSRGDHAIAFVGVRHFDDPDLINRHFVGR